MINEKKVEAILVHFSNFTNTKYLGKVKLMKLFYFLDFIHTKRYASPVTYDTYYNLEHGPIPSKIKNLVDNLADDPENALLGDAIRCEFPEGTRMCKIMPQREFTEKDKNLFSETEMKVLEEVSAKFANATTDQIEHASHKEAPWTETSLLEQIPYYLAARDKDSRVEEEEVKIALM